MESNGRLHQALLEAEEKTKDEMASLRTDLMRQGLTARPGASSGVGNGPGTLHPAPAGELNSRIRAERQFTPAVRNEQNYRISDADRIGEGPPRQKYRQNIDAIRTLRTLEAEGRPATAEEKAVLVRYVGWGAMPQVFDPRNYEWRAARAELAELLTQEELAAARATHPQRPLHLAHGGAGHVSRAWRGSDSSMAGFWNRRAASVISSA